MSGKSALVRALHDCMDRGLSFAAFRIPGMPVHIWAQRSPELETVDGELLLELNQVFLLAPFALDRERIPFIRADVELAFVEIDPDIALLGTCVGSGPMRSARPPHTGTEQYRNTLATAIAACRSEALAKVVVARTIPSPLPAADFPEAFAHMVKEAPEAFVAMAYTAEHGLWMGASPERLVHSEEGKVKVDAIAGTWPADAAPLSAGQAHAKEREEQDLVAHRIHRTCVELDLRNIRTRGPNIQVAGPVAHLHTLLKAELGECLLGDLVLALHPTPAVAGTPTDKAQAFIRTHEGDTRGLYSGFWGPWNADGTTDLYVNLRCLRAYTDGSLLHVGSGITAGSDAVAEEAETERKAERWKR